MSLVSSALRQSWRIPRITVARTSYRQYFGGAPKRVASNTSTKASVNSNTNGTRSSSNSSQQIHEPTVATSQDPVPLQSTPLSSTLQANVSETSSQIFDDTPLDEGVENGENWTKSFKGLGSEPFSDRTTAILLSEIVAEEVEITPDGLLYLPEIRYRRILNRAFGPGGWGLAPRSQTLVTDKSVSREYALICHGRLVGIARGEQDYFDRNGITTAMEGCKSNAMMRCCKDLGIASELWDPVFIRNFKSKYCESKYFEKKRRMVWKRKDRDWEYPYK